MTILDVLGWVLKIGNLLLHMAILWHMHLALAYPYSFPAWRRACYLLLVVALCMTVYRVNDMFQPASAWRLLLATPMTLAFLGSLWTFRQIFEVHLRSQSAEESPRKE